MKKIVFFILLLTLSFRLTAQIDYLEPVKPFTTYTGELGEYYRNVFSLLNTGFQQQPYARFVAIPSFSPEYAMSVEKKGGRYCLVSNTLSRTYWQAEKGTVTVDTRSVVISSSLYQSLGAIFRTVTSQVQDLDGSTAGLDGVVYYFTSTDAKGTNQMGRKWSPKKGSLMDRLVLVCQSAYMLSRGEDISEQAVAEEAAALLKELQQRTKEQPDAYKKPMYVGIYQVGGRYCLVSNTLSRTYWQAEKGTVTVDTRSVVISSSLYQSLGAIFRTVTSQVQDLDGSTAGLDGVVYYFTSTDAKGTNQMGRKWSPKKGSLMDRLVLVCQSAYMLSRGEDISEQAVAEEAAALLKELQQRTKEQPDAYKKPMYVGIYQVGPQQRSLSGKQIEELAHLSGTTPEEYIADQMVYPANLLAKNISGYALCEFTIDKEGVILRPHILKATHSEFAEEALRIVKGMPKWSPALAGGKPTDSNYTLYIPFRPKLYKP